MKAIALTLWGLLFAVLLTAVGVYIYFAPVRAFNNFRTAVAQKDRFTIKETADLARISENLRVMLNQQLSERLAKSVSESKSNLEAAGAALGHQLGQAMTNAMTSEEAIMGFLLQAEGGASSGGNVAFGEGPSGGRGEYDGFGTYKITNSRARIVLENYGVMDWKVVAIEPDS